MSPRQSPEKPAYRLCLYKNCHRAANRGHGYCGRHRATPEAHAFLGELKSAVSFFDLGQPKPDLTPAKINRFTRRVARGDYNNLLDESLSAVIHAANQADDFLFEIGANRFAMTAAIADSLDSSQLSLALSRSANAIARLYETRHAIKRKSFDAQIKELMRE